MIDVIPGFGLTEHSMSEMIAKAAIVAPYVPWVHIDVADHTLVNNENFHDFSQWKGMPEHLSFEAHLMVANPEKYIHTLVDAGFKRLIGHVESQDPRFFLAKCQYEEIEVGLALDGPSPIEEIEPFLEELDVALIMGIEAGFSGQPFLPETIDKLKALHHAYPETLLAVDGSVNEKTAPLLKDAGATRLVCTSFLFNNPSNIPQNLEFLRA